jgi:hypothetical protein
MIVFGYLLAFLTPLMGRLSPEFLAFFAAFLPLILLLQTRRFHLLSWGAPLIAVYLGWLILLFCDGLGIEGSRVLLSWGGVSKIYDWFVSHNINGFGWFNSFRNLLILLLCFGLISVYREHKENFFRALWLGAFVASVSLVLDNYGIISGLLPKANSHWEVINRVSGLFADPNSAGIFLGLMVPFVIPALFSRDFTKIAVALTILTAGLMSGSRSFILALGLSVLLYIPRPNIRKIIIGFGILFVLLTSISARFFEESYIEAASYLPRSLERAALTLVKSEGNDSFESRTIFGKMAYAMFIDHPVTGVGPNGFRDNFRDYEKKIGIDLEGWEDNANNFYLGLTSELGIIGLIALILSLSSLKINNHAKREEIHSVSVLGILLILGPHFDFVEVAIESGLLLGTVFTLRDSQAWPLRRFRILSIALMATVLTLGSFANLGVYKSASTAPNARWTSVRAHPTLECINSQALIQFEAHHASASTPVTVKLKAGDQVFTEILKSREMRSVSFNCLGDKLVVDIITEPPFRPGGENNHRSSKVIFGINILNYPEFK